MSDIENDASEQTAPTIDAHAEVRAALEAKAKAASDLAKSREAEIRALQAAIETNKQQVLHAQRAAHEAGAAHEPVAHRAHVLE